MRKVTEIPNAPRAIGRTLFWKFLVMRLIAIVGSVTRSPSEISSAPVIVVESVRDPLQES